MTGRARHENGAGSKEIHGVIVVDKPAGCTSFDVVRKVRKALKVRKVGHTGTLDPLATGVLPLCLNEATKAAAFLAGDDKEYRAVIELGVATDTQDITGAVVMRRDPRGITRSDFEAAARSFLGTIRQKVPRYSAAKYRGRPYYWWTRQGVGIDTPEKEVSIYEIEIESFSFPSATFRVLCSKGTYIRALCDDIGERLGCGAVLTGLRRTRSGAFREEDALPLDSVAVAADSTLVRNMVIPLKNLMGEYAAVPVDRDSAKKIRDGRQPTRGFFEGAVFPEVQRGELVRLTAEDDEIVAVARVLLSPEEYAGAGDTEQVLRLVRVFNGEH